MSSRLFTRLVEHAPLRVVDVMGPLIGVEYQMGLLRSRRGSEVTRMTPETVGMAEAGRQLGLTTREVVQLVYDRRIRYVIVKGIPRIPQNAVEEYRNAS